MGTVYHGSLRTGGKPLSTEMKQDTSHEYRKLTAEDVLEHYAFQPAMKTATTRIKLLTEQDVAILGATFRDLEGRVQRVEAGRYLCLGVEGERWTSSAESMKARVAIDDPDADGFQNYVQRNPQPVQVTVLTEPFILDVHGDTWVSQNDGGVITWNGERGEALIMRLIARDIFEKTYQFVKPDRQPQHFVTVDLLIVHPATQSVLLIQRKKPPFKDLWALPGGHVEVSRHETLEQAARRELREETGLECSESWALRQLGTFGDPGRDPRGPYAAVLYGTLAETSEQPIMLAGDDAKAVAWFPLQALPALAFDHARMVPYASLLLTPLAWQRCEKLTPTYARQLTQADYEARQGIIETREGPAPFTTGDYLAVDDQGEYPIQQATIEHCYVRIAPPDAQGFARYRSAEPREALQQSHPFTTDRGVTGQAGDYLMRGRDGRTWPCARAKFEHEYRFV